MDVGERTITIYRTAYGLNPRASEYLLPTLNCSSAGGVPSVTQNKAPRSIAEAIVIRTSLKFIV